MYIKVRPMTGGDEVALTISKLTKIEELRLQVQKHFSIAPEQQRLFFQGKQASSSHFCSVSDQFLLPVLFFMHKYINLFYMYMMSMCVDGIQME
jgi:hypothetical protein